jgi:hypothetical protein
MNDQHVTDRDLKAAFAARAAGAPNLDLAARISAEAARTRQSRPFLVLPGFASQATTRLAWAAVLAALTVALVGVVAFSGGSRPITGVVPSQPPASSDEPGGSPSADPSPVPTAPASPSVSPSEEPSGAPFVPALLGPDRIGRVVATDGLRVRSLPTVGEASEPREPLLPDGTRFYVVDGPVFADGYAWYQVDPYGGDEPLPFGWVAAGSREGEPWVENFLDGCDSVGVSIRLLHDQPPQESLYCYGEVMPGDIELTGDLHCELADVDGFITGPEWLESDRYCSLSGDGVEIGVVGKAATSLLEQGSPVDGRYTVVGHFDDPEADECTSEGVDIEGDSPDPAEVVLSCRMQFVITEVTPAGS